MHPAFSVYAEALTAAEDLLDAPFGDDEIANVVNRAYGGEIGRALPVGSLDAMRVITGRRPMTSTAHSRVLRVCWIAAHRYGFVPYTEESLNSRHLQLGSRLRPDLVLFQGTAPVLVAEFKPSISNKGEMLKAIRQVSGYADVIEAAYGEISAAVLSVDEDSFYDFEECCELAQSRGADCLSLQDLFTVMSVNPWAEEAA